jgi:hypothetical protein
MTARSQSIIMLETEKFMADASRTVFAGVLCTVLRCPSADDPYGQFLPAVGETTASDMEDLRACLPDVFCKVIHTPENPYDISSLLVGLERYNCWDRGIQTESGSYNLACGIVHYLGEFDDNVGLDLHAAHAVCAILNAWIRPGILWTELPNIVEVCAHLFGPQWCHLVLPDECWTHIVGVYGNAGRSAAAMVQRDRPPFINGLCPAQGSVQGLPLPAELGIAP